MKKLTINFEDMMKEIQHDSEKEKLRTKIKCILREKLTAREFARVVISIKKVKKEN